MTAQPHDAARRPPVHIGEKDFDALYALALAITPKQPEVSGFLMGELERAEIHAEGEIPSGVVTMGSMIAYLDTRNGETRTIELVYPHRANIAANKVSITTPVGASLIGLSAGDTIMCGRPRFCKSKV